MTSLKFRHDFCIVIMSYFCMRWFASSEIIVLTLSFLTLYCNIDREILFLINHRCRCLLNSTFRSSILLISYEIDSFWAWRMSFVYFSESLFVRYCCLASLSSRRLIESVIVWSVICKLILFRLFAWANLLSFSFYSSTQLVLTSRALSLWMSLWARQLLWQRFYCYCCCCC